jgi:sugar phosphate isomerase/epimerase
MMRLPSRRDLLRAAALATAYGALGSHTRTVLADPPKRRRFTRDLACGRIGVRADLPAAIAFADRFGFESVEPSASYLAKLADEELAGLLVAMRDKGIVWGAAGLPVDFRKDDQRFRDGLQVLPRLAAALKRAGVSRVGTWISPGHDHLTYVRNFRQHAQRLRAVAKVLGDFGQKLGLEYVGPKTSWTARRYPFIHSMAETKDLISEIGCHNVGFVLDSWHWYTAGETQDDLLALEAEDVVACDLNDAPAGRTVDQQIDNQRELPAATGVIDLKAFLDALVEIGYDGPVRAEPFNRELNAMPDEEAVAATARAMKQAFELVD